MNKLRVVPKNLVALLSFAVCSFITSPAISHASEPTGVWRGEWRSQSTGHHGPMRAVVRPNGQGGYNARFTGRFALVIPFMYKVTLNPSVDMYGNPILYAQKPLGPLLGSYQMSAMVNEPVLSGSFQAVGDTGSVTMQRIR